MNKKITPPGGLEPPTFRLTAERASRLRHGGLDVNKWSSRESITILLMWFFFQLRWRTSARRARTRRCRCRTLGESGGSWWLKKSDTNTLSSKHLHFKATHDEVFDVHLTFLKRTVLMFCISFKYHLVESNWGIDAREMTSMPADYVDTSGIKVWTMARSFSCNRNILALHKDS